MTARPPTRSPGNALVASARWLLRARPADYLLAASVAPTALPVIGKHFEPLGGMTAMGVWGLRHLPRFVSTTTRALLTPGTGAVRKQERDQTRAVSDAAVRAVLPEADLKINWPAPERRAPVLRALQHRRNLHRSTIRYGNHPAQVLDVWRRDDLPVHPAPVLIYVPGGAWVHGSRILQGYALLSHLAEQGWVCLSIDYRVAPHHRWPRHINDVNAAIAWARANVDKFGGDRNFVALAGASAGGHLAALAGLTRGNDPEFTAELPPGSDTSVDAVVGLYGRYDWYDQSTPERAEFVNFLERVVVGRSVRRRPELYQSASPITRVHPEAPPFLVVHGSRDRIIPVQQARSFVERLREVSQSPVGYLELPGAGHGFDLIDGTRTGATATAIGLFLDRVHRDQAGLQTRQVV